MASSKEIGNEIDLVGLMGNLVYAYEAAYVSKIQTVRNDVLGARNFRDGLESLLQEIRKAHQVEISRLEKKKGRKKMITRLVSGEGRAAVLFSSSKRMSGEINQRVFADFSDYLRLNPDAEPVLVGDWARDMFVAQFSDKPFIYMAASNGDDRITQLKNLAEILRKYKKIEVFYAKYVSLVNQVESRTHLGETELTSSKGAAQDQPEDLFLFEPNLSEVLKFFDDEIFEAWLDQTSQESYLAHMGGRITSLETAVINIEKRLRYLKLQERKHRRRAKNKRQLQVMASVYFWRPQRG